MADTAEKQTFEFDEAIDVSNVISRVMSVYNGDNNNVGFTEISFMAKPIPGTNQQLFIGLFLYCTIQQKNLHFYKINCAHIPC